jgi:hypothetical protein
MPTTPFYCVVILSILPLVILYLPNILRVQPLDLEVLIPQAHQSKFDETSMQRQR